jgi:ethanolamine utilization protein EutN
MKLAVIKGYVTSTVKHRSLKGWRLLIAQPVDVDGLEDGAPQICIDCLGAAPHQQVLISNDGKLSREMVKDERSPARWNVIGIVDPERDLHLA